MITLPENEMVLTSPPREMDYQSERIFEILAQGIYLGFQFLIVNYGWHPCCYVGIPKEHPLYGVYYFDSRIVFPHCHGGITYSSSDYERNGTSYFPTETWILGWDYGHAGDFSAYHVGCEYFEKTEHKWTIKELLEEVKEFIIQVNLRNYKKAYK